LAEVAQSLRAWFGDASWLSYTRRHGSLEDGLISRPNGAGGQWSSPIRRKRRRAFAFRELMRR
jgi:hypothetical protein